MQHGGVRVQVECREGADPRAFFVGERRLHVMRVLERGTENSHRIYRVRVVDGREFVLIQDVNTGQWQIARIDPRRAHAARR